MDNSGYIILLVLVVTLMFLAFLFLIRELICWYYKINERLEGSVALIRKGCIFNRESDFKKLAHRKF